MDIDEDDDIYSPEATTLDVKLETETDAPTQSVVPKAEELEEGEEEDEGGEIQEDDDDSDIDIIVERKDGSKPDPPPKTRYSDIRNIPQRSTSDATVRAPSIKREEPKAPSTGPLPVPTADQAAEAASNSKINVNTNPVYPPAGKPIMQVDIDKDLPEGEKPWRKPGTDLSDYFNYGFDEFTWALYAAKQDSLRSEYSADSITANNKKMMEEFNNMMMMGGMGMPGAPGGAAPGGMPAIPGMDGMPPEMQQMLQQMMASGMDPSQMDPSTMAAMYAGMQNPGAGGGSQVPQGSGFSQGFGGQGQDYGYGQGMQQGGGGGGGGGGGRGGFGGARGRGRRW